MEEGRRIYLDKHCDTFCMVDHEDYDFLIRWTWGFTWDRTRTKKYATRMTRRRKEGNKQIKVYMHKVILERSGKKQPTENHHMGDHEDGDSLNNRRANLSYATPSMNRRTARKRKAKTK